MIRVLCGLVVIAYVVWIGVAVHIANQAFPQDVPARSMFQLTRATSGPGDIAWRDMTVCTIPKATKPRTLT